MINTKKELKEKVEEFFKNYKSTIINHRLDWRLLNRPMKLCFILKDLEYEENDNFLHVTIPIRYGFYKIHSKLLDDFMALHGIAEQNWKYEIDLEIYNSDIANGLDIETYNYQLVVTIKKMVNV